MTGTDSYDNLVCLVTCKVRRIQICTWVEQLKGLCLAELQAVSCNGVSCGHGAMLCAWRWCCAPGDDAVPKGLRMLSNTVSWV